MLQALATANLSPIVGEERIGNLPEGVYPCRLMFFNALINVGTEEEPVFRPFDAWDAFTLNADKSGIILDLQKKEDKAFEKPTVQAGCMFEVIHGKYAEKHAHIPYRFNLQGYMTRSDYSDTEWEDSGFQEIDGFAVHVDDEGRKWRILSDEKSAKAESILKGAVGAIFGDLRREDGTAFDHIDLQIAVEEGQDMLCNVVLKKDLKDPKRVIPVFFNRYDEEKSSFVAEEVTVAEEATLPD